MKKTLAILVSLFAFGSIAYASIVPVNQGGTSWGNIQAGAIPYGNGTSALSTTTQGVGGQILAWLNGIPTWTATSSINNGVTSVTGTYPIQSSGGNTPAISIAFGTTTSNTWAGTQTFTNAPTLASFAGLIAGNSGVTYAVSTTSMNASITGNAGTATAFASTPTKCSAGNYPLGIDASGNAQNCTAASSGSGTVSTSTNETSGFLPYWTSTSATPALLGKVGTTTISLSGPLLFSAAQGTLVGGNNTTLTWTGLSTTTQPSASNLLTSNGGSGVYGTATSTLTASSPLTGSFTQVGSGGSLGCQTASGSQAGCLSSADWTTFNNKGSGTVTSVTATAPLFSSGGATPNLTWAGLATTSQPTLSQLLYSTGGAGVAGVATTSETCTSPISCTAHAVLTGGGAISLGTVGVANGGTGQTTFTASQLLYGNGTAALSSVATSSLTATGLLSVSNSPAIIGSSGAVITLPLTKGNFIVGNDSGIAQATSSIFISSTGNVGIGTTSPDIIAAGSAYKTLTILGPNTVGESSGILELASQETDAAGNLAGTIDYMVTANTVSATKKRVAYIAGYTEGTTAADRGGRIVFGTKPNGGTATEVMRIDSSGNVGIGTTGPGFKLEVNGTMGIDSPTLSSTGDYLCWNTSTKEVEAGTATCTLSSQRFKRDITPLDASSGLAEVLALNPVQFYYKPGYGDNGAKLQLGFIAEQAAPIDERLITRDKEGIPNGFIYQTYTAVLTKAIQDFYGQFQELVARVTGLEARLNKDEEEIRALNARLDKAGIK